MGSRGDIYDNAETINGLYKAEVVHRKREWRRCEDVKPATLEWVHWYNHERMQHRLCQEAEPDENSVRQRF